MGRNAVVISTVIVMVGLIIGLDVTLLRDHFLPRLIVNVGVVLAFAVMYLSLRSRL